MTTPKNPAAVGQMRLDRLNGELATAWQVCHAPPHLQRVHAYKGIVHYETPTRRAACTIDAWESWEEVPAVPPARSRLLAYLTDDVVRILPRWVAWLEAAVIFMAMVQAVRILLR
jgi:hypothetical protein